jgi:hypothetical protein
VFHSWHQAYRVVYISPRLDSGVVNGLRGNGGPGCYRGASARLRGEASVVSTARSGGHAAGVVDAAQVILDELIHLEKCW